jgi:hypothetical protein
MNETVPVTNFHDRSQVVYLRPAAWDALGVFAALIIKRCADEDGGPWTDQGVIDRANAKAAGDPILTALLAVAATQAEAVTNIWGPGTRWIGASAIVAEHNRIDPQPAYVPFQYDDDTCRHGVSFDADCPNCEV